MAEAGGSTQLKGIAGQPALGTIVLMENHACTYEELNLTDIRRGKGTVVELKESLFLLRVQRACCSFLL